MITRKKDLLHTLKSQMRSSQQNTANDGPLPIPKAKQEDVYLVYRESEHSTGIVSAVADGFLCFPREAKQMSAQTPALAQPPSMLPWPGCRGSLPCPKLYPSLSPLACYCLKHCSGFMRSLILFHTFLSCCTIISVHGIGN